MSGQRLAGMHMHIHRRTHKCCFTATDTCTRMFRCMQTLRSTDAQVSTYANLMCSPSLPLPLTFTPPKAFPSKLYLCVPSAWAHGLARPQGPGQCCLQWHHVLPCHTHVVALTNIVSSPLSPRNAQLTDTHAQAYAHAHAHACTYAEASDLPTMTFMQS